MANRPSRVEASSTSEGNQAPCGPPTAKTCIRAARVGVCMRVSSSAVTDVERFTEQLDLIPEECRNLIAVEQRTRMADKEQQQVEITRTPKHPNLVEQTADVVVLHRLHDASDGGDAVAELSLRRAAQDHPMHAKRSSYSRHVGVSQSVRLRERSTTSVDLTDGPWTESGR